MSEVLIIFPTNLYERIPKFDEYILCIDHHFTHKFKFNQKKLMLHIGSCKFYKDFLKEKTGHSPKIVSNLEDIPVNDQKFFVFNQVDYPLGKRIARHFGKQLKVLDSPSFLLSQEELEGFTNKSISSFYKYVQKQINIKFARSYDEMNRQSLPPNKKLPKAKTFPSSYLEFAKKVTQENFSKNPGNTEDFFFPLTHKEAKRNFKVFLERKLDSFGEYQDAIDGESIFVFHSNISSSLNTGLLDLEYVIRKVYESKTALNNKEGFLRQILGWREYCRLTYDKYYHKLIEEAFFDSPFKMSAKFYRGETGISFLDFLIKKMVKNAYLHHIERLILGALFQMLRVRKDESYRWFMEMQIDSYDWCMRYNMCMVYFSDTFLTTKPYLFSSNYIKKMSTGISFTPEEEARIDALYWGFISLNKKKISRIYRLAQQVKYLGKHQEDVRNYKRVLTAVHNL